MEILHLGARKTIKRVLFEGISFRNILNVLIFLFFLTISADKLSVYFYLFTIKANYLITIFLISMYVFIKKSVFLERKFFYVFLLLFSSICLSTCFSPHIYRTITYDLFFLFNMVVYFFIPINFLYYLDEKRLLDLYFFSFQCMGIYAILQFIFPIIGIKDIFQGQTIAGYFIRPQAFTYEPSYYALYMTSYVIFYNMKCLLSNQTIFNRKTLIKMFFINLMFLISTSTSVFFCYLGFFSLLIFCCFFKNFNKYFKSFRKNVIIIFSSIAGVFICGAIFFHQIFVQSFFKFFYIGLKHHSFVERWRGLVKAFYVFLERPIFGVGIGGVGPYIFEKEEGNINVVEEGKKAIELYDPTNVFTELFASIGLVGMIILGILSFFYFRTFILTLKKKDLLHDQRITIIALLASIVLIMFVHQFNQGIFRSYIWLHLAIAYGYVYKIKKQYVKN